MRQAILRLQSGDASKHAAAIVPMVGPSMCGVHYLHRRVLAGRIGCAACNANTGKRAQAAKAVD